MGRKGRAIAGVALIGAGVAIATGWWWPSTAEAEADLGDTVRSVEIDNNSGDVRVRVADVESASVHQRFRYTWGEPDDAFELDGGTLRLTDCGWNCSVDYEVVVPRAVPVSGEVNSGDIVLVGAVETDVHVNSGDIDVRVPRVSYRVTGESNSGSRTIDVPTDPDSGHLLELDSNSGDVTVRTG